VEELEKELDKMRKQAAELEGKKAGLWGYISGA
jgi:hypothetical protein